ncbi:hypothetical protein BJI67_01815 [Acidihalobacter aeolianus]|uniref:N-acetyltransferase domain-containing protein n=1 Tax=Acidihalobacter aeolianus TaxID=2792603 RepID=A0A1D8K4U9_9GAMM|nr:GNAT family N-acetyltransferase [Acidihalobacter aeolianus]AOV15980.1 hypothetical protein BJI67_01815 [Acidihalobacter aeolianus]
MDIRHARIEDAETVVQLYLGYDRPPEPAIAPADLVRLFADITRTGYIAVADDDGEIVGSYTLYFCASLARGGRPFAVIENVIVAAHRRRQDVGRALMAHARDAAHDAGCYKVMLATGARRPQNLAFYESCGFSGDKVGFQIRFDA